MPFTEVKARKNKKYYYRTVSYRHRNKVMKRRIYLGANLSHTQLLNKERKADMIINAKKIKNNLSLVKNKIMEVLKKYKVKKAGIFGSYVRGENKKDSDIDIIIEPPKGIGLGFVGIALELEDKLGKKVDLLSYNGISPYFKKSILKDEVKII